MPSVFDRKYNYYCFKRLDIGKMQKAAKYFVGNHDFKALSDNKRMKKSTTRTIYDIDIYGDNKETVITVKGDDFWPHMVRILVGTLMEVGLGNSEPSDMEEIIQSKNRDLAGPTAEAKGLFLVDVLYE